MDILRTARLFNLPRLEDKCTEFLADNIEAMADDTDLHKIIRQDANEVKDRQETDSIQVIDDIRSHIRYDTHIFINIYAIFISIFFQHNYLPNNSG